MKTAYQKAVGSYKLLNHKQEIELAKRIEAGDQSARELLINSNLRLAISMVKKYVKSNYSMEDLIQEANIGLMVAADKYDWRQGTRFSTYAVWWIRQTVNKYIDGQTHVKLPSGNRIYIAKINKCRTDFFEEFGYYPTDAEISIATGIPEKSVKNIYNAMQWPVNLDAPIKSDDGGTRTFGSVIPDNNSESPEDKIDGEFLISLIRGALSKLTPQEERIIRLRFGITEDDADIINFPQIGE